MWILFWKKYKLSKLATFVSIVGALTRYAGVMCLVEGLIAGAIVCIAIGCGLHFAAEQINFNSWVKNIKEKGYEEAIKQGNTNAALQLIQANPGKKTEKYIASINPAVANVIKQTQTQNK